MTVMKGVVEIMAQKGGNNVKAPVSNKQGGEQNLKEDLAQEHHGESTDPLQEDKRVGQHNGAGRPPLMKK